MRRGGRKNARCEVAFFFVAQKMQHLHFSVKIVFLSAVDPLLTWASAFFLEGVADPNSKCDPLEYTSIWVTLTVTTVFDQTSGLIAALFMALFTSTFSSSNENPVRRMCDAVTFPQVAKGMTWNWRSWTILSLVGKRLS